MVLRVERADVVAFRLDAHDLTQRLDPAGLVDAAGRCGVQNSPPGSALLALHARVRGVTPELLAHAVAVDKSLLQSWSMRGAPFFFPTRDAAVFTSGVLPPGEEALRHFLPGVVPAVDALGMSVTEAADLAGREIAGVLSGRRLAVDELGADLAARIADHLSAAQRGRWERPGPWSPGQPLGEGVVHFCLRVLTLRRVVCFAPREGNRAPFVLLDEWLGGPGPDVDPRAARAELLRRYLRCYGPSTRGAFAAWLGVRVRDTEPWWGLVEAELTPVDAGGPAWMLTADVARLGATPMPTGVRLLPPRDPYTQLHDRAIVVEPRHHRDVWTTVGEPGTVLADGEIVGTWRPRRRGRQLTIAVTSLGPPIDPDRPALLDEAAAVARLRGATDVTVEVDRS